MVVGIICFILEIFTTSFFFISIGLGAIITGILSLLIGNHYIQILIFIITTFLTFLWLKKISIKVFASSKDKTNIFGLINQTGTVTKEITSQTPGLIKIRGDEWSALSENKQPIPLGTTIIITAVNGNKVIVKPADMKS